MEMFGQVEQTLKQIAAPFQQSFNEAYPPASNESPTLRNRMTIAQLLQYREQQAEAAQKEQAKIQAKLDDEREAKEKEAARIKERQEQELKQQEEARELEHLEQHKLDIALNSPYPA